MSKASKAAEVYVPSFNVLCWLIAFFGVGVFVLVGSNNPHGQGMLRGTVLPFVALFAAADAPEWMLTWGAPVAAYVFWACVLRFGFHWIVRDMPNRPR